MTCMGGAVPYCYLLLVFLGQLELCPSAFLGLGVQGLPCTHLLLPVDSGGIAVQTEPQCGEWAADGDCVQLCTCAPLMATIIFFLYWLSLYNTNLQV